MKLLIIEDDADLSANMCSFLTAQGYLCAAAYDFASAREKIEDYSYDCIVIDLSLPGGDGLELLRLLRAMDKLDGVIIVSARNQLDDKIVGLNLGADDYLTKPFHLSELSVRIAAIIRRKSLRGTTKVRFEEIEIDVDAKAVYANNEHMSLTHKEYDLLLFFMVNKGRVISKNAIAAHLWGDDMDLADNYDFIYTHIKNLRKKLESAGAGDYIQSIYGMGYKFGLK